MTPRVAALFVLTATAFSQQTPDATLKFEVASVKPAAPNAAGTYLGPGPGGGLTIANMSLKDLIIMAYGLQPFQASGGPPWVDSARYDIVARPKSRPKLDEIPMMLQALLADRFHLALHRETKELPIYALVVARTAGKLGPNMKESACIRPETPTAPELGKGPSCGFMRMARGSLQTTGVPLDQFVVSVSRMVGRKVVDKTGLMGGFDMTLEWTADQATQPIGDELKSSADGLSIFAALQEQLGLKMESQKGPVEIFVIDRAEKPSEK
jgi:uncharacterized protein (TIGR03435 family)